MTSGRYEILALPGDGTGPEVVREGRKVLAALAENGAAPWHVEERAGGAQYYQRSGKELDPETVAAAKSADAILLGAVGWPGISLPNGDIAGAALVLGMRQNLDLYANVRPCKLYPGVLHKIGKAYQSVWTPENVDMAIIRENTEGLYTPARGRLRRAEETEVAIDTRVITRKGSERVIRYAFELARRRKRGAPEDGKMRVTCIDKSNVLEGCRFFREVYDRVAALVLGMRQNLDLYANVRPCKLYPGVLHKIGKAYQSVWTPENVDMVIIRENTEGLYTPARGRLRRAEETEVAIDTRVITRKGSERVIRYAFELARRRKRGAPEDGKMRVTCIDKSNVLEGCRFFREVYDRVAAEYPDVERDYAYVDAFTQWLVRNPEHYDVVVATNMMGDIITDLASVLQGGMGFAAGGNIGDAHGMFEPVHGSAPKYAGKNQVNPFATFSAVEMMLRWLGERHADETLLAQAGRLERAIARTIAAGTARTYDQGGHTSTSEAGDRVAEAIRAEPR